MTPLEFRTGVLKPVEIYKEAWELMKDQYWLILAITLVGILIGSAVPIVIIGPMICGIYLCLFDKIDGREVKFEQLFKGFDFFLPGLIVALIAMVPVIVLVFTIYIPMVVMAMTAPHMREEEILPFIIGIILFELVVAVLVVCLHTLLMFAFPLIADRKLSAGQAIKLSVAAVWQNLGGVVGLFCVGIGVGLVGYLLFCIGIYLVMPLIFMANAVAFRKIFPRMPQAENAYAPPPPNAYQGL